MSGQEMMSKLLLLELNELNFEFVEEYVSQGHLPTFQRLFQKNGFQRTTSESTYENLEPWIQWVTAHTGLDYDDHRVFRLGDIVHRELPQIWEELEQQGLNVGAISPMNARQRMRAPAFFLPDPWTDGGMVAPRVVQRFYRAVAEMVNENAEGIKSGKASIDLAMGASYCARPSNYSRYLSYAAKAKRKTWNRALFLDLLLSDLYVKLVKRKNTDFSSLFLNSAAHIQHHYMFSSSAYQGALKNPDWYVGAGVDPVLDVYNLYDHILGTLLEEFPDHRVMIATGLHQVPYPEESFYWRLRDHEGFLLKIGVPFERVVPRMSRDFLVECRDSEQAAAAERRLGMIWDLDRLPLFEIDNRGTSLFVTLSYRHEIQKEMRYLVGNEERAGLGDDVAFVAIKNGHHDGIGYFLDTGLDRVSSSTSFPLNQLPERIKAAVL